MIGAGRVGCSMGRALAAKGHRIVAASTRSPASAARVRHVLGDVPLTSPGDAALAADIIVVAVPDDALEGVVSQIAGTMRDGAVVVHTSGLHGHSILSPCGENIAATHPAQAIASASSDLGGVWFGVTCPEAMRGWTEWFVAQLGGRPHVVAEADRPLYHAALVMASNFAVALAGDAGDLIGAPEVLAPLLRQTVENVIAMGADAALTGPVVRGDAGTVAAHLSAMPPHLVEVYVANARRALDRAVKAGRLDAARAAAVADALGDVMVP